MAETMENLPRYQQLRKAGLAFNMTLTSTLSREEIEDGAMRIGIFRNGAIVLDTDEQIGVLMDFCLHDVWRNGINAIERFYNTSPPPMDSDEMLILQGKRAARFSLFMVDRVEPGHGVHVRDLLYDEDVFVTDIGFSRTGVHGLVMAFRLMTVDGIAMTTGAPLPVVVVPADGIDAFIRDYVSRFKSMLGAHETPQGRSGFVASLMQSCLAHGASMRIRYADSDGKERPRRVRRKTPRAPVPVKAAATKKRPGPNDRCPCGSGRKLKNCCGSWRS